MKSADCVRGCFLAPVFAPRNDISLALTAETVKVLSQADVRERFLEQGLDTVGGTPAEFDKRIRAEHERWGRLIRARGITLE